jgi:hypothetical protein
MAEYRNVQSKIWEDEWFVSLDAEGKVLFFYLITNHRASVAGIYTLPIRSIEFETGLKQERVASLLAEFEAAGKLMYADSVIWVTNLRRYQETKSPTLQNCISRDIAKIPPGSVKEAYSIRYGYPTDTVCIPIHYDTIRVRDETTPKRDGEGSGEPSTNVSPEDTETLKRRFLGEHKI